jgi:carboxyl-terminal processing protease
VILSIAKYGSPAGKHYEDDAVTPGTLVASAQDDLSTPDDQTPGATKTSPKKSAVPDDQLTKAIDLLKAKNA